MTLREWMLRLVSTLRPRRRDDELEQELQLHVDLAAEAARRRGMPAAEAERLTRAQLGGTAQAVEALRDQRHLPWLADAIRDARHAVRGLRKHSGFALVSVLSLAIGIGANCAAFSFADALLLRPPAVPDPWHVLTVGSTSSLARDLELSASYADYVDLRDRSTSFSALVAFAEAAVVANQEARATPRPTIGLVVSRNFFDALGVSPQIGRAFRADEDAVPGRDAVVMLSHELWEERFGADPAVLGRTIRLNHQPFTIVGVTPRGFMGFDPFVRYQFYAPIAAWPLLSPDPTRAPLDDRGSRRFTIKGRLRGRVTLAQARAELSVIGGDLARAYPETSRDRIVTAHTELQHRIAQSPAAARLVALLGLLAIAVLMAACANVAGLLTSRAPMRVREVALRMAIGASRPRVVRLLLTEATILALIGSALGLGVAYAGVLLFRQFRIPTDLPIAATFALDGRTLLVSVAVALVSVLLFGLLPAVLATRADLTAVMRSTEAVGHGRRRTWGRGALVGLQVALSVVLLAVATSVYRGFQERVSEGPGFRTAGILVMWFQPGLARYSPSETQRFFEHVVDEVKGLPDVASATLASYMPMDGGAGRVAIVPDGVTLPVGVDRINVPSAVVDESYFDTLQIPILSGRAFSRTDTTSSSLVAVVNEQFAARYWPGEPAVGKRLQLDRPDGRWAEIVGVAKTTKYEQLTETPREFVYFTFRQRPPVRMALLAASPADPSTLMGPLQTMVRRLDPDQPIFNVRPLDEAYRMRAVVVWEIVSRFVGALGLMGLALALVGLYALVTFAVSRRTREIGIRMAIGADRASVLQMVLRHGMVIALGGLSVGLIASVGVSSALTAVVPGGIQLLGRVDAVGFLFVALTVLAVTFVAAWVPAQRAARISPTEALRCE